MARFCGPTWKPCGIRPLILIVALAALSLRCQSQIRANPINVDLSLGLSSSSNMLVDPQQVSTPIGDLMEQIMNDKYEGDFLLSISLLNQLAHSLESFIRNKNLENQVASKATDVISTWATSNGYASQTLVPELDRVVATFWTQFKPTLEIVIAQRPPQLGPNDLDFRCTRRAKELGELMALGAQSSLYSIYMDTFVSELYRHCLLRKLALLKTNGFEPSPLLRQFVAIYLNLPTTDPQMANSEMAIQMLARRAASFNLADALATVGPLTKAASLVVDPRTFLSSTPDDVQAAKLVGEFANDCKAYISQLNMVWRDFDDFVKGINTDTSNLEEMNQKVKFAAPRLIYGTICSQLCQGQCD